MAYKYREEIVGKRFLSVSGFTKLKLGKIGEWGWRAGVIRAASHKDSSHPDLQVLVEYDDVEWQRREWISIYKDSIFRLFLVEQSLVWTDRVDPLSPKNGPTVLWPALSFTPLVATVDMAPNQQPLEFLLDLELAFRDYGRLQPYQEWDPKLPGLRDYPELRAAVRRWSELQDGQRILVTTPSVLVGYRVEVYRAEGTTQWYTAVIVSYNEATRDLTVTDDTVLEDHNEDPCIVQMRLIGDGVVESIMRGENVGITPRRSRSSAVLTQHQQQQPLRVSRGAGVTPGGGPTGGSSSSGGSGANTRSYNANTGAAPVNRKLRTGKLPPTGEQPPPAVEAAATPTAQIPVGSSDKGGSATKHNTRADRRRRNAEAVSKPRGNSSASDLSNKEDLENKGNKRRSSNRGSKKKVLEEANNSKLRRHVQVRVEDCLHRTSGLRSCKKGTTTAVAPVEVPFAVVKAPEPVQPEPQTQEAAVEPKEPEEAKGLEELLPGQEKDTVVVDSRTRNDGEVSVEPDDDKSRGRSGCSVVLDEKVSENEEKCNSGPAVQEEVSEPPVTVEDRTSSGDPVVQQQPATSSQDDDDGPLSSSSPYSRMEIDSSATALLRFPDDRSDSGVSSLRSGSGDERSGSRSSALSCSDEQQNCQLPPPLFLPSSSNSSSSDKLTTPSQEPVRVWRDPSLLLVAEPHVRHINSVQHQTLLMSHPSAPAATAPPQPPTSSSAPTVVSQAQALALAQAHYPPVVPPPPPLLSPHPLHHHPHAVPHHLPPPGLYSQLAPEMLWNKRYPPLPVGTHLLAPAHAAPEEILVERERERAFRERQNQEARELEKQHKEREKERERVERERQEREKLERERQERQEREKMERERQERIEHERQERERIEKHRAAEQAVHKHFEESLRLAHQKRNMCWSLINSLPPPRGSGAEEERKRANEHDLTHQQQRLMAERLRQDRYYPPGVQRPPSAPKVEYPPPAHSRVSGGKTSEKPTGHTVLPKAEPNFNLFGYPAYHPGGLLPHDSVKVKQEQLKGSPSSGLSSLVTTKSASASMGLDRERDLMLPNPPPLMSDIKNSVIVKNEGKSPHHPHESSKVPPSHSPSPKLRVGDMVTSQQPHYLPPTSLAQHKTAYEYRSPTQSPHHLAPRHTPSPHHAHMTLEPQNLAGKGMQVHHRSNQQSSPHTLPHRQSPHTMQQQPHPSPPEQRYCGTSGPSSLPYGPSKTATVGSYPYPSPVGHVTTTHYSLATGGSVTAGSKPKVSSPAPPHIYGKPGITTGTPVCRAQDTNVSSGPLPLTSKAPLASSVSPSPYQQMSPHHHPPPHQAPAGPPPPPAHSRVSSSSMVGDHRGMFDRMYPGGASLTVKPLSQHQGSSPPSASAAPLSNHHSSPLQIPHQPLGHHLGMTPGFQTQPLDLGVSSDRGSNRDDLVGSPKRKGVPMHHSPGGMSVVDPSKKRRCDQPNLPPQQIIAQGALAQPLLSRVSEPSPLIASAATPITTVVNTAAYCTPAATTMMVSLSHEPSTASTTVTTSPNIIPARTGSGDGSLRPSSPGITTIFPATGPSVTLQQSNSPLPLAPPASSSSPNLAMQQQQISTTHTPVKPQPPSSVDSDKSNSPGPVRPTTGSSYPVHKLKKAWLQRHSGEDGTEDTTGMVGSGSCVTLPLNLGTNPSPGTGIGKDNVNSGSSSVSSLQTVLSCKGKANSNKGNNRKGPAPAGNKEGSAVTLNGHATDIPSSKHSRPDDSSSSDPEHKSPPKRKPPKVKRKKGGGAARKAAEEKRKKLAPVAVHSESGSDSDKESLSDKDSDSGASTNQSGTSGKKSANGGGGSSTGGGGGGNKEPRKRGRRPKSSKNDRGEEPRQKKSRDDPPAPQRDPFRKPPISQLKKTGESFLQDGPCHEVAPKLAKCRECRWTPNQRSKNMPNIFCRFYAFRRLRYTKNGQLAIAGFSDPHTDAAEEDLKLWLPLPDNPPADLDLEMSRFLLTQVGDQFCDLLEQEKESIAVHMSEEKTIAWKRVVQGVREMCDVCETTLFNFHWACNKCGFVVCIDCYKGRKNGSIKIWGEAGKDRDEFSWLFCTNRQAHEQEKLMLTQIIAGDSLLQLGRKVHEVRGLWCIPQYCGCPMSEETKHKSKNGICKDLLKAFKNEPLNGLIKQEKKEKDSEMSDKEKKNGAANGAVVDQEDQNSPLNWLADVALSNEDKKPCEDSGGSSSDSDEDKDGNYSTLRELLIRPSHKPNGSGSRSASPANNSTSSSGGLNNNSSKNNSGTSASASVTSTSVATIKGSKKSRLDTLDEVISSVIEHSVQKEDHHGSSASIEGKPPIELKHFVRRYNWVQKGREPLPIRIMTLTESKILYPDVPHSWLCDGKLLRLHDPNCEGNYRIFQDQWKRGQPVIVSDVTKRLDMSLWHPDSFARDFGEDKNDLINCMTGNLVPNQPMRKFWEGFEHFSRRLKDDRGNPMLLKLKDWPPGEDFAEMLPSRFSDLMRVLPLTEYTHRTGRLNLASRLPECFVRPDLGPKMYNAYGSALYSSKGTTNLHLDISDAVNVMVYVGIPKDGDSDEHIKEAFRSVDAEGCDILTRRRVRETGELPGALWHIYNARDADKIRDLLNKVALEREARLEPHHDPIHDQSWYLDSPLRERLYQEYGVEGYAIAQCLGDSVFIPAGAPHQVRNLHNCIKVAEDFVSPENVSHCFHLTQEFRELSDTHSNHEDKLQIKNIIYHAVKDSLSVLTKMAVGSEEFLASLGSGSTAADNGTSGSSPVGEPAPPNGSNEDDDEDANSSSHSNGDNLEIKKEPAT